MLSKSMHAINLWKCTVAVQYLILEIPYRIHIVAWFFREYTVLARDTAAATNNHELQHSTSAAR
jgi:hypothetical protein